MSEDETDVDNVSTPLRELAFVFLKLGVTGFGGPVAHIAMVEQELVGRRQWLTREKFLDLLGATNLIPGPNSTELAIHIGQVRGGWRGLVVAGVCFIFRYTRGCGGDDWDFPAFIYFRGAERADDSPDTSVSQCSRLSGRSECGVAGLDVSGNHPDESHGVAGLADIGPGDRQCDRASALQGQFGLARSGGRGDRCHILSGWVRIDHPRWAFQYSQIGFDRGRRRLASSRPHICLN
jgi:hypothetical protein